MQDNIYKPINCNLYDVLLAKATLKKECLITFISNEKKETTTATIVDVYTKTKEEFMQLNNEMHIRLDKIISVDGVMINETS